MLFLPCLLTFDETYRSWQGHLHDPCPKYDQVPRCARLLLSFADASCVFM